jgi:hypothetical protein
MTGQEETITVYCVRWEKGDGGRGAIDYGDLGDYPTLGEARAVMAAEAAAIEPDHGYTVRLSIFTDEWTPEEVEELKRFNKFSEEEDRRNAAAEEELRRRRQEEGAYNAQRDQINRDR